MSFEIDYTIPSVRMATRAKALHKNGYLSAVSEGVVINVIQTAVPISTEYQDEQNEEDYESVRALRTWHQHYEMREMPEMNLANILFRTV